MSKKQVSQKTQIEKLLRRGRLVTAAQARDLGIQKPSARIRELRLAGLTIESTTNKQGTPAWKMPLAARKPSTPAFA